MPACIFASACNLKYYPPKGRVLPHLDEGEKLWFMLSPLERIGVGEPRTIGRS
jgi:hypothetical protein